MKKFKTTLPPQKRPLTVLESNMEFKRIARLQEEKGIKAAWDAANDFWARDEKNPVANFAIAVIVAENGSKLDALKFAKIAVEQSPNNAGYLCFLGKLNLDLDIIEDAPPFLERAFQIDPLMYQAPWMMAKMYYEIGMGKKALPYYDQAKAIAPEYVKDQIHAETAVCLEAMGRGSDAKKIYEILEFKGDSSNSIKVLTRIALIGKNDQNSEFMSIIKAKLELDDISENAKSELLLCMGRLFENGEDFDSAFNLYQESRRLKKPASSIAEFEVEVSNIKSTFTRKALAKVAGFGSASQKSIFVVGMPRSGTTMTEQIIAGHSLADGVGELTRIPNLRRNFVKDGDYFYLFSKMQEVGPLKWRQIGQTYLNLAHVVAPNATYTVDKLPHNFLNVGFIKLCFPNAKIILCRRHPLDNFISAFQNAMSSGHWYSYNQEDYGKYYLLQEDLMNHWKSLFPESIYDSHYELLTANPEQEVRKMLEFLELSFEESCLNLEDRETTVRTFSRAQVRNAINTSSVARWKRYEKHLNPLREILERGGYSFD
jgi:tetratricopeptide (TPR) repeat protein